MYTGTMLPTVTHDREYEPSLSVKTRQSVAYKRLKERVVYTLWIKVKP